MTNIYRLFLTKKTSRINYLLVITIFFELFLKLLLIFKHEINWDEFYFISKVHSFQRGELFQPFQNFHVHLLGWVPWVSGNEVTQIIAARCALFLLFIASGILLYRIAQNFINDTGALFAVFCWLSLSNVIRHGSSLRYDSFCSFLFLLACFALLTDKRSRFWTMIAGISMGISLLISLKAAIHVVSLFALIVSLRIFSKEERFSFRKAILFIIPLVLTFGVGFRMHQGALAVPSPNVAAFHKYSKEITFDVVPAQQEFLHHISSKAIVFDGFFPQRGYLTETLLNNLVIWILLAAGIFYTILKLTREKEEKGIIALTFLAPLFAIPFYRNAFPYFYVFAIAPAIIFCGILPQRILNDFQKTGSKLLLLIFTVIYLPIVGSAGFHFLNAFSQDNGSQKVLLSAIHQMFPDPVHYIDGCSAVASHSKVGFFMSTWGFENYLAAGQPVFRQILQEAHPQFLLANKPQLDLSLSRENPFFRNNYDLLAEDQKTLEENFIRQWGMLWIPGKTLHSDSPEKQQSFEILIPGPYVIESNNQIILDNSTRSPGDQITLSQGRHTAQSMSSGQKIVLRWGKFNHLPIDPPSVNSMFYGF